MGIFDKLKGELIDIVECFDDAPRSLAWRFPRYQNELKNGAHLIVRPGQLAVLVREGQLADAFAPGTHVLSTSNLPVLSTLAGWAYGYDSPFKAEVYFVSTRSITDLKWGTSNAVMLRDPELGPVRLRAFGNYTMRAVEPRLLLTELVGTAQTFNADALTELLRSVITSSFGDLLGESQIAAMELARNYEELSEALRQRVSSHTQQRYGLEITSLQIVNIAFPDAVEKALDARSQMSLIGDLERFQTFQMANALTSAAENAGTAGGAMGLGVGFAMAQQLQGGLPRSGQSGVAHAPKGLAAAPPPLPSASSAPLWHVAVGPDNHVPVEHAQLLEAIRHGQVSGATLVWCAGMDGWKAAGEVPALARLFAPPPMR